MRRNIPKQPSFQIKIILLICGLIFTMLVFSQSVQSFPINSEYGTHYVIPPTIDNLTSLIKLSDSEFEKTMLKHKFVQDKSSLPRALTYYTFVEIKNSSSAYIITKNILNGSISIGCRNEYFYPKDIIDNLYRTLKNYYTNTKDDIDFFQIRYNDMPYVVSIKLEPETSIVMLSRYSNSLY